MMMVYISCDHGDWLIYKYPTDPKTIHRTNPCLIIFMILCTSGSFDHKVNVFISATAAFFF